MYKILASIDGSTAEDDTVECYTDGTLQIAYDDRTEKIESTPLPTDDGQILEGYFLDGYCFVELAKL